MEFLGFYLFLVQIGGEGGGQASVRHLSHFVTHQLTLRKAVSVCHLFNCGFVNDSARYPCISASCNNENEFLSANRHNTHLGSMVPWFHGSTPEPWNHGTMEPQMCSLEPRFHGSTVPP